MAVPEQTPFKAHTGNGVTTVFAFDFLVLASADMLALVNGAEVSSALYSVAGTGVDTGGTVTFNTAPANGASVVLLRESVVTRETDYQSNGDLLAAVINRDFDRLWLVLQEIIGGSKSSTRTVRGPVGEVLDELPAAATRADMLMGFDSDGNPSVVAPASGTAADVSLNLADAADTGKGDALIGVKLDEAGTAGRTQHDKNAETVSVLDFGAVGDGTTDDTDEVLAFLSAASNRVNEFSPGTYKITSLLNLSAIPLSNCVIRGVPGKTKITGSFGYGLLYLGELTNVRFEGITFETTYVNATEANAPAVVYTGNTSIQDSGFFKCTFTAPNAGIQGLGIFCRDQELGSQTCTVDGLHVEHCIFEDIGRNGCTIYNRQQTSDRYTAMKNIFFRHNIGRNLGTLGAYGFLVSLDGYGTGADVSHNVLENFKRAGIENTGYNGVRIAYNTFLSGSNTARAMSAADPASPDVVRDVVVVGNICLDGMTAPSYVSRCESGYFAGNHWSYDDRTLGAGMAFLFLDADDLNVVGDRYVSDSAYAVQFQANTGTCSGNRLTECTFDTSASSAVTANVNFTGASCTNNQVDGRSVKGTGGAHWTQTTSAANNVFGNDATRNAGTYTPTLYETTNIVAASAVAYACFWTRIGNVVTVSGRFDAQMTAAGDAVTTVGISLPISSTFNAANDLAGTASPSSTSSDKGAAIFADIVNHRASASWKCAANAAHGRHFQFSYLVL